MESTGPESAFAQYLLDRSLLSAAHIQQAGQVSLDTQDAFARSIAKLGFMPESVLADALADFAQLPRLDGPLQVDTGLEGMSLEFLRHHALAPLQIDSDVLRVAWANPLDEIGIRGVQFSTERILRPYVATFSEVEAALQSLDPGELVDALNQVDTRKSLESLRDLASDAPVIRLVQRLITIAVDRRASDIHIEPTEGSVKVRFRLDGVLQDVEALPQVFAGPLVSRIKVMSQLDIAERRLPQDGRLHFTVNGKEIDFRVATAPTLHGESVVLRILDRREVELDFKRLGFDSALLKMLQSALQQPYGIILSTGPTGSGKTTTLYTALKELNRPDRKILTVEDPIEYTLTGINQTQVKPQIGYTFAAALRAFLRQDPDVLMVGEIRDRETAEVAIQAALTGHLLLSTLHTNSAAAAITRLLDMGIDDFLLTSTLNLVIGQRLVRRLCAACRQPYEISAGMIERFGLPGDATFVPRFYKAVGCAQCGGIGYIGRTGLMELLELSEPIRRAVLARADANAIERAATDLGMRTMFRHGLALASAGETSLEEVLRVTRSGD